MDAQDKYVDTARYELFRISDISVGSIEIHPNKSFSTVFNLLVAETRNIRAITILKPYVTRLQAIPQSGAAGGNDGVSTSGREQAFVVISPARGAGNDNFPPYLGAGGPGVGDGSWLGGGFTESRAPGSGAFPGDPAAYGGAVRLPIPNPLVEATGNVFQAFGGLPPNPAGHWQVATPSLTPFTTGPFAPGNLPIVRISATQRNADFAPLAFGTIGSCLGWFDVVDTFVTGIVVSRVPETDPSSGLTYWGPGPYVTSIAPTASVAVGMTLHESISRIWLDPAYPLDKVESSRLRNIIDPIWAERFEKQVSDPLVVGGAPPGGSGPGRPDKAIFATNTSPGLGPIPEPANPGNLMDLGFRMVLFPAKEDPNDATQTIPDFDRPITGRELVIDGSISEKQWVDIDYSSGVVRLSHPPPGSRANIPDEPSDVIPNGIAGTTGNNIRGEVVLFAACVPYSMEDSQAGTGARVTTHAGDQRDFDVASGQPIGTIDQINTLFTPGSAPYIGVSPLTGAVDIVLDRLLDIPETGIFSLTAGNDTTNSFGRWGYTEKKTVLVPPAFGLRTALGGLSSNPAAIDPTPAAVTDPRSVVIRREMVLGPQSLDVPGLSDFFTNDTTYGSSLRADNLRFRYAQTRYEMDGSVTIDPRTPGYMWNQMGQWTSSGIPGAPGSVRLSDTGLLGGVFYQDLGSHDKPSDAASFTGVNGQFTSFTAAGALDFDGVVTQKSEILLSQHFRLVMKFELNGDATATINQFVGLIGPRDPVGPPPPTSLVMNAAITPPTPTFSYLGLRFDGPGFPGLTAPAEFFAQNLLTPAGAISRPAGTTWGAMQNVAHYLVIETTPYFDPALGVAPGAGAFVKMALFNSEFEEVGSTQFVDQEAVPYATNMELVAASWNAGAGVQTVGLYNATIVNHTELPFHTIP
jgi:hypothetical protein